MKSGAGLTDFILILQKTCKHVCYATYRERNHAKYQTLPAHVPMESKCF